MGHIVLLAPGRYILHSQALLGQQTPAISPPELLPIPDPAGLSRPSCSEGRLCSWSHFTNKATEAQGKRGGDLLESHNQAVVASALEPKSLALRSVSY